MKKKKYKDSWRSPLGAILAVAGGAIGLGNFLRFPSQVAEYGGSAFMVAYAVAFILLGLPLCWAEWTVGRYGGAFGYSSSASIYTIIWQHPLARYLGAGCLVIVMCIFAYYIFVEAWCLGYAVNYLLGGINIGSMDDSMAFWSRFVGLAENGGAWSLGMEAAGIFLVFAFGLNFYLIYKGVAKGIELFCKAAMPTLLLLAFIVLIRVLTLGAPDESRPENSVINGLGYMWNPTRFYLQEHQYLGWDEHEKELNSNLAQGIADAPAIDVSQFKWKDREVVFGDEMLTHAFTQVFARTQYRKEFMALYGEDMPSVPRAFLEKKAPALRLKERTLWSRLKSPQIWLAAASQVFFSLSVGFGVVLTYASYMKKNDDIALSCLTAASANEFTEVALGGLIAVPAGFAFLGASGISGQSTFGLGFHVLPMVFGAMPLGSFFGFLFFFLLFLAAIASTISLLQPGMAFLEETLCIKRKDSIMLLFTISAVGCFFVSYYSKDVKALDTLDFWVGSFMIFAISMFSSFVFSWKFGDQKLFDELHRGAAIRVPRFFLFCMKYITPFALLAIFLLWLVFDVAGVGGGNVNYHIIDLFGDGKQGPSQVAWMSIGFIICMIGLAAGMVARADHFDALHRKDRKGRL